MDESKLPIFKLEEFNINLLLSKIKELNIPDFYNTKVLVEDILPQINRKKKFNSVNINDEELMIKYTSPCEVPDFDEIECSQLSEGKIIHYVEENMGNSLVLPNILNDGVIGGIMSHLINTNIVPSFENILGVYYDPSNKSSYIISRPLEDNLLRSVDTKEKFYYFLFFILYTLVYSQNINSFTHYKLFLSNIMIENDDVFTQYKFFHPEYHTPMFIKNLGFIPKIVDFSMSRVTYEGLDIYPEKNINEGKFSRQYDILTLIGDIFNKDVLFSFLSDEDIFELFENIFEGKTVSSNIELDQLLKTVYGVKFSSKPKYNNNIPVRFNVKDINKIFDYILKKCIKLDIVSEKDILSKNSTVKIFTDIKLEINTDTLSIKHENISSIGRDVMIQNLKVHVDNQKYVNENDPIPLSDYKITPRRYEMCPVKEQYVTVVFFDTNNLNDFELGVECCKIDVLDYFDDKVGVVINGGSYDLKTYKPIGDYRKIYKDSQTPYYEEVSNVPEIFEKFYGILIIGENNDIKIERYIDFKDKDKGHKNIVTSGPLLIKNGVRVFDENTLKTTYNFKGTDINIFQCRGGLSDYPISLPPYPKPQPVVSPDGRSCVLEEVEIDDVTGNCEYVKENIPGELYHSGNSMARSAIVTRRNDDGKGNAAFVYVEGGDQRGMGMTIPEFTNFLKDSDIKAMNALNLDDPKNKLIAYRADVDPGVVYMPYPSCANHTTVGNIIYLKKDM